jgi:hypothetical protein
MFQASGEELTPRQVTTSIGGLAKLGIKWSFVSSKNKEDIVDMVGATALALNDREVSNLLHSLSKMNIPWSAFSPSIQASLTESFVRESVNLISQQGSMSIYSLGLMGLDFASQSPVVQEGFYSVALSVLREDAKNAYSGKTYQIKRFACQQISNVIYGLAKGGVKFSDMPQHVYEAMDYAVQQSLPMMNEQEVSNVVYSWGLMGFVWDEINAETQTAIRTAITLTLPKMITQGFSTTLYGMGLMSAPWGSMGEMYQTAALDAIVTAFRYQPDSPDASPRSVASSRQSGSGAVGGPQAVANVIYSLGLSGADWFAFPSRVKEALTDGLEQWGRDLHSQEMSNVIYGLAKLGARYSSLPPFIVSEIENGNVKHSALFYSIRRYVITFFVFLNESGTGNG